MKNKLKKSLFIFIGTCMAALSSASPVFATGGGNPITDSVPFKGMMKLLNDAGIALLIIAPIVCGLLIGVFALIQGVQSEPHDKEKWTKNKKTVFIVLIWVFAASGLVSIVGGYFS